MGIDVRDYWNFDDPAASEGIFRQLIEDGSLTVNGHLEVWAQIARTHSLRGDCEQCHQILDEKWDHAMAAEGRPMASFQLERGRAFRTGKELDKATPYFKLAAESEVDDLKVDALHMLAIDADTAESLRINLVALEFAQASPNPWAQRWQGTLYNNMGWSCFGVNKFNEALVCFENAVAEREKYGKDGPIRIAKWCVGRCHRALGNLDKAFDIQSELVGPDASGFVYEELGEILFAQGKSDPAKPHFAKAVAMLQDDLGAESERITRLKSLG